MLFSPVFSQKDIMWYLKHILTRRSIYDTKKSTKTSINSLIIEYFKIPYY